MPCSESPVPMPTAVERTQPYYLISWATLISGATLNCLVCVVLATTLSFASQLTAQDASGSKGNDHHVIVVSLDGLAAFLVDDPKASLPTIRKLAREGAIADGGMKVSNPSVTWPNHTTMISGVRPAKHGVLANGVLVRGAPGVPIRVDPKRDRRDLVRGLTVVDLAHRAGLRTGEINWPCTRASDAFNDSFPDVPESLTHTTPRLRSQLVSLGLLEDESDKSFALKLGPSRDWVWTEAACHLIQERKPHLLLVHLLNVDSTHHALGAQTASGYTANALIDLCLDRIIRAVETAGILDKTTIFVVSDHGFITTPKAIKPNMLLRQQGLLKQEAGKVSEARVHVFPEGGVGLVYFTNPTETAELSVQIQSLFTGREGVADVVLPNRFAEYGLPLPREYEQAPDAVLVAKEGYAVSAQADGEEFVVSNVDGKTSLGSHGFISTNSKMNGLCVLWGNQVRAGTKLNQVENVDIAPTIAKLLNLSGLEFDGKVLTQALRD
jgi:predicted AlkP superfamily pyrophosphatase or phosphodiesterase